MTHERPAIQLVPFSTDLLDALRSGLAIFDVHSPYPRVLNWPNKEFLEAVPHFFAILAVNKDVEKLNFLILRSQDSTIVGEIGAKSVPSGDGEIEIGYGIAPSCRRLGYATQALKDFKEIAFQNKKIVSLRAECLKSNIASVKVLKSAKFIPVKGRESDEGPILLWRLTR